jgi:RNA polymerase sigma-70 factor (ECF subfamily)
MSLGFTRDPLADTEELIHRIYAYVAYRLGDGPEAEDVTSEVFERALRYRSRYDRSKGEPIAWLLGIARRCVSAALAERGSVQLVAEVEEAVDGSPVEEDSIRRLTVAAAVEQLAPRDQELVALRFGADLTAAQIARIIGIQTNAVEVALHRALGRLRSIVEPESTREAVGRRSAGSEAGRPA